MSYDIRNLFFFRNNFHIFSEYLVIEIKTNYEFYYVICSGNIEHKYNIQLLPSREVNIKSYQPKGSCFPLDRGKPSKK